MAFMQQINMDMHTWVTLNFTALYGPTGLSNKQKDN